MERDPSLDTLLLLDGESFGIEGGYWVKFRIKKVTPTPEKPHGLTLHDSENQRLLGFDNAHSIRQRSGPGAKTRIEYDHKHKGERVRFTIITMLSLC